MKLSDIQWSEPVRPLPSRQGLPPPGWLRTARIDKVSDDGVHRLGKTIDVAWWPDLNKYGRSGYGPEMSPLEFAAFLKDYGCQVFYNAWGEF